MNNLHCEHDPEIGGSHWISPSRLQRWWFGSLGFRRCFACVIKEIFYISEGPILGASMVAVAGYVLMLIFTFLAKSWIGWVLNFRRVWFSGVMLAGLGFWVYLISKQWVQWRKGEGNSYPVQHAMAEIELAYGMLERAHQHIENGEANEAGACLLGYAAASGIAKDDLKAVMHHNPPNIDGPAALFPKEPGQSDLDYWYDLCHRAMGLIKEAEVWVIERRNYYQAYLRLLCASGAVEQMMEIPKPGPCQYCKEI